MRRNCCNIVLLSLVQKPSYQGENQTQTTGALRVCANTYYKQFSGDQKGCSFSRYHCCHRPFLPMIGVGGLFKKQVSLSRTHTHSSDDNNRALFLLSFLRLSAHYSSPCMCACVDNSTSANYFSLSPAFNPCLSSLPLSFPPSVL